ncbi:MAG TPA: hypothetical protein VGN36_07890, partial [Sphingorhabdus sp.]|nr:hypothetical protein [Sphingorhabdus sp.]
SAVPASFDAAVGQAYADSAVKTVEQAQIPVTTELFQLGRDSNGAICPAIATFETTNPVLRHDVIRI